MCITTMTKPPIELEWEGESSTVSLAPHNMADNRICLHKGYLVILEVMDFPLEYWSREFIRTAFYPFGPVIMIE
jgi:hypothetical protein